VIPVSDTGLTGYSAMIAMRVTPQEMFYFAKKEDSGEYVFINSTLREDTFHNSETGSYFANHYEFLNYRGYVWAHTVPLLKKHILLGGGAESFVIEFPNDDYIARYNVGYSDQLVNKPHNLYLQIWMLYGFPALLAFLAAAVWYFIDSVKTYKGADLSIPSTGLGIGLALGVFGYLVCGLANDSCVAVAPLFWVMWGFGMAVNKLARKSRKEA
ncbi:MAG: O-antigen ligase family protein, partial [Lachnospiraceae bacterium]|nr:O-antigen ligase family protein [Lachnospiraceae bacterium]